MTPYEVYKHYISLKVHFTKEDYDFLKYRGSSPATLKSFDKRKDKQIFEYMSTKIDSKHVIPFLVSNFVIRDSWIGDLVVDMEESISNYRSWKAKMDKIVYIFEQDMHNIKEFMSERDLSFEDLIDTKNGQHSILFRFVLQKMIKVESFVILDNIYNIIPIMDENLDDIIWEAWSLKFRKYKTFMNVSVDRFASISENILMTDN